jgi:hypothetical protein
MKAKSNAVLFSQWFFLGNRKCLKHNAEPRLLCILPPLMEYGVSAVLLVYTLLLKSFEMLILDSDFEFRSIKYSA